jgi:hypothetical protein
VVELLRQGIREAREQRHADARADVVSAPEIPEFRGCLLLNRVGSRWGEAIGHDPDSLAMAILYAYGAGEFDSVRGGEAVCGFGYETLKPFSLDKDAAKVLGTPVDIPYGRVPPMGYLALVKTGQVFVSPEALALFAKQRGFAMPEWLLSRVETPQAERGGGRPPAADWDALEVALEREIDAVGFPSKDGPPGWQFNADVVRWLEPLLGAYEPGKTALKDNAKRMVENIRAKKAGN